MCGIVAIFSAAGSVTQPALGRATDALYHRGPDSQGHWLSADRRVGLGHRRLSIIDLDTGGQPIGNEDGTIQIVVNGEFYDHDRLRNELQARGHRLASCSDSEIALHLYEEYGTAFTEHLRGEFAFVLWDGNNQQLIAARDRFGIKPLHYAWHQGTLYLASEAKALFAAGVPARWDPESVNQMMHVALDHDRTVFAGVYQVPPGQMLVATRWASKLVPYWDLDHPRVDATGPPADEHEYIDQMRTALFEATRLRLRADVPVGCYLSGGLDSCSLLGVMSQIQSTPVDVFTISFEVEAFDERPIAEEMARLAGANFHCFDIGPERRANSFADSVCHAELPIGNGNGVAKFLLSEHVRDAGLKVVLTGEGSDEIFGGYSAFRRDMVRHQSGVDADSVVARMKDIRPSKVAGNFTTSSSGMVGDLEASHRTLGFTPDWFKSRMGHARLFDLVLADHFKAEWRQRDPLRVHLNWVDLRALRRRQPVSQGLYLWIKSVFPNLMLNHLGDRAEMAHSVEGRTPFLDHHLVELVNRMPLDLKIRGVTEKYVLREAAKPYITDTVYKGTKHPFVAPMELTGPFATMVADTLGSSALDKLPFFDSARVRQTLVHCQY